MRGTLTVVATLVLAAAYAGRVFATENSGHEIYQQKCASCHGDRGQGTDDSYPHLLIGDKSPVELAEYIAATMPEGEPENCVDAEALAVAKWMEAAFYSPEAQARINPPQKKPSRLTVNQYRNAIADLAESFQWRVEPAAERGLKARYYKSKDFKKKQLAFERVDKIISFDFGEGTPDPEKIPGSREFSISFEGSVIIEETGWYDFTLKTENGARLFINDGNTPLIDAWVQSGDRDEYTESVFLLAGRIYLLRLEWFTFQEKTASIQLQWTPPHGVRHIIPSRHLTPQYAPYVLAVEAQFPPDDRNEGYIRGTAVSPEWYEAVTFAAIEVVDKLMTRLPSLARFKRRESDSARRDKVQTFCRDFQYRAFRRPVGDDDRALYVDDYFASDLSTEDAVRRSLLAILKSPRFLYREVTGQDDLYAKASRLSFALWDSIPHPQLLTAAKEGWIASDKGLRDQAWQLANTFRGRTRLHEFLRSWLNLDRVEAADKDDAMFPEFTPELFADLRSSLDMFLAECAASRKNGLNKLLTNRELWVNNRIAGFYGIDVDLKSSAVFKTVTFEPDRRAGIVTHPFLLTALAYRTTSSPIHRGVFLSRGLLGRSLKPPPDSVSPVAPNLEPHLTTRQRVARQTSPTMCANCHTMINALGFTLEEFDAVGRFRSKEKDAPIDASGQYRLRSGKTVKFRGATELGRFLAESSETHRSFSRQLFHHMVQQPILAYGPNTIDHLADFLSQHQLDMTELTVEIGVLATQSVRSEPPTPSP